MCFVVAKGNLSINATEYNKIFRDNLRKNAKILAMKGTKLTASNDKAKYRMIDANGITIMLVRKK